MKETLETACPLDCPDSCSLNVTIEDGRVQSIEGSLRNPVTAGYICATVRRFGDRVYGSARILRPGLRNGPKGSARFNDVTWDAALDVIAEQMLGIRARWGAEAILPFSYGGSNGLLTQDTTDARLFRRFGTSRLARTVCAAPTGTVHQALYGKMPAVTYPDYIYSRLIVIWGANPSNSGIHLVPYIREARRRGALLVVVDPVSTQLARQADLHLPVFPGTDVAVALALHRYLFENGLHDQEFLAKHTRGSEALKSRAASWTCERASAVAGVSAEAIQEFAKLYASVSPAVIRCGYGLERNRNGGNAAAAILALPAVAGKFGIRGGGFTMSTSAAWPLAPRWIGAEEPGTRKINMNRLGRALGELDDPPIRMLFVYNANPAVTVPDQKRVLRGLFREDLFTVVFDQVMTDTAALADVVLPATTFLEQYDLARGYGSLSLQLVKPVIPPVGEARTNVEVFAALAARLGIAKEGDETSQESMLAGIFNSAPPTIAWQLEDQGIADPPIGEKPIQFLDVFPGTADGKVDLFPASLDASAPGGLYTYQEDPATPEYPLALISPATNRTITSTMGELPRPAVALLMNSSDAAVRGLVEGQEVRVFNLLGEVHCPVTIRPEVRAGTVVLPKGLWRKDTLNGLTATALVPDTLTDLGAGACFNDARVQVAAVD